MKEQKETEAKEIMAYNTNAIVRQVTAIQNVMQTLMKEGEHYGVIPGTQKPTLLKSGAEKLALMFRLIPEFEVETKELGQGHVEYNVKCQIYRGGELMGSGIGSATTKESRYRFRWIEGTPPSKSVQEQEKRAGRGRWRKQGGKWIWEIRTENANIWDTRNTVLKIAKKRAFVDAILTVTAGSDIFTQDVEDLKANGVILESPEPEPEPEPETKPKRKKKQPEPSRNYEEYFSQAHTPQEVKELYANLPPEEKGKGTIAQKEAIARAEFLERQAEITDEVTDETMPF